MESLFNGFKRGSPEIPLEDFLTEDMKKKIKQYNLFYVIRPKADTTVFKIGISSGFNRLESYLNYYGFTEENKCTGVLLYYLVGTKKQKNLSEFRVYLTHVSSARARRDPIARDSAGN